MRGRIGGDYQWSAGFVGLCRDYCQSRPYLTSFALPLYSYYLVPNNLLPDPQPDSGGSWGHHPQLCHTAPEQQHKSQPPEHQSPSDQLAKPES